MSGISITTTRDVNTINLTDHRDHGRKHRYQKKKKSSLCAYTRITRARLDNNVILQCGNDDAHSSALTYPIVKDISILLKV